MQTSPLPLGLSTVIAIGFGAAVSFVLASGPAQGYPAGAAISSGSNPVVSTGGRLTGDGGSLTVFTAPAEHDLIVTDVVLTGAVTGYDCRGQVSVQLKRADTAETLARFTVDNRTHDYSQSGLVDSHFVSGIVVPAGVNLALETSLNYHTCSTSYYHVDYTLSGYLAQP
jgi:F0F1-type ATP synthase assembly protein I